MSLRKGSNVANGMSCLAAQVIAHFKTEPGRFYVHPAGTRDVGESFVYELYCGPSREREGEDGYSFEARDIYLTVRPTYEDSVLYDGPLDDFDPHAEFH